MTPTSKKQRSDVLRKAAVIGVIILVMVLLSVIALQRAESQLRTQAAPETMSEGRPLFCYWWAWQCLIFGNEDACRKYDQHCGAVP